MKGEQTDEGSSESTLKMYLEKKEKRRENHHSVNWSSWLG